jgi:hypothetical protein
MPYDKSEEAFHQGMTIVGKISKWGGRYLDNPYRYEADILLPSQQRKGDFRSMLCVRLTVYDPKDCPGPNDYCRVTGLPQIKGERLNLMAFGIDVKILARWVPKEKTK